MRVGRQVVSGFQKVTTTDHDSAGNSVLVTAMFCKWCEMADFKHINRGVPVLVFACENLHLHFLIFVCVHATGKVH